MLCVSTLTAAAVTTTSAGPGLNIDDCLPVGGGRE